MRLCLRLMIGYATATTGNRTGAGRVFLDSATDCAVDRSAMGPDIYKSDQTSFYSMNKDVWSDLYISGPMAERSTAQTVALSEDL